MSFSVCDPGWTYLASTNKCYRYDQREKTWSDALESCKSSNPSSTLASVPDSTTNDFLADLSGGSEYTWLGGYQDDQEAWHWTDGSRWTWYNNWGLGQPDNHGGLEDHLGFNFLEKGQWNDFSDTTPQGSICQYSPGDFA